MPDTTANAYAPTSWGQVQPFSDLEVPSGQLCQVRPAGVESLIAAGVLENADTLTSLVDEKHLQRVSGKNKTSKATTKAKSGKAPSNQFTDAEGVTKELDTNSLMQDAANMQKVFTLVDKVVEYMVVQPNVRRPIRILDDGKEIELPAADRVDGVIYTDMVSLEDRMFIFQYSVGGGTDLESFREQFRTGMDSVAVK